ncbi:hypothetical protein KEM52_002268 [Ascosphaera acerosa]|nr:hypothetical protein KEM52_002268 [Ascosphaera acerosa]
MASATTPAGSPDTDRAAATLDLGVSVVLYSWPALSLAVDNHWGGPKSAEKREWLCGEIPEILRDRPETDDVDVEEILVNVMMDEFDVAVEDDSAAVVAGEIIRVRDWCARGDFAKVKAMWEEYERKQKKGGAGVNAVRQATENDDEGEDDEEDDDTEMADAPAEPARPPRSTVELEVDDDGFTTVVHRKRR